MVRLTDRPDMTLDVCCGRQQQYNNNNVIYECLSSIKMLKRKLLQFVSGLRIKSAVCMDCFPNLFIYIVSLISGVVLRGPGPNSSCC